VRHVDWKRVTAELADGLEVLPYGCARPEGCVVVELERVPVDGMTPKRMRAALWERRNARTLLRDRCVLRADADSQSLVIGALTHPDAAFSLEVRKAGR
jgi:hypothetical protein